MQGLVSRVCISGLVTHRVRRSMIPDLTPGQRYGRMHTITGHGVPFARTALNVVQLPQFHEDLTHFGCAT